VSTRSVGGIVLGIGNPWRRDDGAGPAVATRLSGRLPESVAIHTLAGDPLELVDALRGAEVVVVVDATVSESGVEPGTVHRFDATAEPLPATFGRLSSHGLGLAEAVELARTLGCLPRSILVYGIEGADFHAGQGLSPAVETAVRRVTAELIGLLAAPLDSTLPA